MIVRGAVLWAALLCLLPGRPAGATGHLALRRLGDGPVALAIDHTGVYRITGAYLLAHGIDWSGYMGNDLSLSPATGPIGWHVSTAGPLSAASVLTFFATATSTIYTTRNVVLLSTQQTGSAPAVDARPRGSSAPHSFPALYREHRRTVYDPAAPGRPWFYTQLTSTGTPTGQTDRIRLPEVVAHGSARIRVRIWAVTNLSGTGPQHHVRIEVNGHRVVDVRFSGSVYRTLTATFPASYLHAGGNAVRMTLPGDVRNAYNVDSIDIQSVALTYPHAMSAPSGRLLAYLPASNRVNVDGLPGTHVSVWKVGDTTADFLTGVSVARHAGRYRASFRTRRPGTYAVASDGGYLHPSSVRPIATDGSLTSGHAGMVIVAPRAFLPALRPLAAYHSAHGLPVKLVDIDAIYARYTHGLTDPAAISAYLTAARSDLGARYALLVGADSYDYHHFIRCTQRRCPSNPTGASLIPSPYLRDAAFGRIPSDELLVNDAAGAPTLAIGRVPTTSAAEVKSWVTRTLSYLRHGPRTLRAVFAAGREDPTFTATSLVLAAELPVAYRIDRAYSGTPTGKVQRTRLIAAINRGSTIVNFVGHGNLEQWGTPPALLTVEDVPYLAGRIPAIYLGWGCQTAYDVDPTDRSLNARLLFAPHGAILTAGSTGLDRAAPQAELAETFFHEMFHDPGVSTVGEAFQVAEVKALAVDAATVDPIRSYELFGDPAIPLSPIK